MSQLSMFEDTSGPTSLAESEGGNWRCNLPAGQLTSQSGQEVALANPFRVPAGSVAALRGMGYGPTAIKRILRNPRSLLALAGRSRVGRLKGYGNAIVPQVAAVFIRSFLELIGGAK